MTAFSAQTILFVDDDPVVQAAYRLRLEREGFLIRTANDGVEAMRQLALFAPDVVILDLMLPKLNGVDVVKFIHSTPRLRLVTIIVLSTNSIIDKDSDELLKLAHRRLIKEQCTPDAIIAAIRSARPPMPEEKG